MPEVPLSVLDLSPIREGESAAEALRGTAELARHAEALGYRRFWVAEHHNMPGIASAATAVVLAHVGACTQRIRIGSGGIMLPNHAPLVVAEQFGTLEALFPGRVDLGIGRAPGTDPSTARALRRDRRDAVDTFPTDVQELQRLLGEVHPGQAVRAVPGGGSHVPLWLLGSSTYSAALAAELGLPFAFAAHFAPDALQAALDLYRDRYRPSAAQPRPQAMAAVQVIAAETEREARRLFTSLQQSFVHLHRGTPQPLPPPVETMEERWLPHERAGVERAFREAIVGSAEQVRAGLAAFLQRTQVDELMITSMIHDRAARLRSFTLVAELRAAASAAPSGRSA